MSRGDAFLLAKQAYMGEAWDEEADGADWRNLWDASVRVGAPKTALARCVAAGVDAKCIACALDHAGELRGELVQAGRAMGWRGWPRSLDDCSIDGGFEGVGESAMLALRDACEEARAFDLRDLR